MEDFLAVVLPRAAEGHLGLLPPILFGSPPKFCCAQKYMFSIYDKNKNLSQPKNVFSPKP